MTYTAQTWVDGPGGGTPLSAARLNALEVGAQNASLVAQQALDSLTGNFIGSASDDRLAVLAVPQRFSGIDPTGASNSQLGLQAALAATPSGGTLVIPAGTYRVDGRITITNPVTIWAYGATFVNNSNRDLFLFQGAYETVYNVTATSNDNFVGSAGENLNVITCTLSGSPAWSTGDIVKVVADNLLPDPQVAAKPGEHRIVVSVSGSTVTLAGRFRDPMTTNIRISRKRRINFALFGGSTTASSAVMSATAAGFPQIRFQSAIRPVVRDHQILNAAGPAFAFDDCYEWVSDQCSVDFAKNGTTVDNTYGYGINDQSSEFGLAVGFKAARVRHAYTCNGGSAANLGPFEDYGRTYGTDVVNGHVYGATQTGWDTHGNGRRIRFINCQSIDCYSGFSFRGIEGSVIGGLVQNARQQGIGCFATGGGKSFGHFFGGGLVIDGGGGDAIFLSANTSGTYTGIKETTPTVLDGIYIKNLASGKRALAATNQTVHVGRINTTAGYVATNSDVVAMPTLTI